MNTLASLSTPDLQRRVMVAKRLKAIDAARKNLMPYIRLINPDPEDADDPERSLYEVTPQGDLLCEVIEAAFAGRKKRIAVSIGPQHGKSQVLTRSTPAWWLGRRPRAQIIAGTYNQPFANQFGDDIRTIIQSPAHRQVFPDLHLESEAKDYITTSKGGKLSLVGVGGSGTGKAADIFIVDDPFKNDQDANSEAYRNEVWKWFASVVYTRLHNNSVVIVVHCMTGDTPVLMADGSNRPLRDIRPGDAIATYRDGSVSTSTVLNWANQGPDVVYEIKMESGITVRANERHPFLVERNGGLHWTQLKNLKVGDTLLSVTERGEASFAAKTAATVPSAQKDYAPITTARREGRGASTKSGAFNLTRSCATDMESALSSTRPCSPGKKGAARFADSFLKTLARLLAGKTGSVSTTVTKRAGSGGSCATPAISQLGTQKLSTSKNDCCSPLHTYAVTRDVIAEIALSGVEDVFDIQVADTENFIANGLASHNTRWHEDDLIGRLCDPDHPERHKKYAGVADDWFYLNLPAVVTEDRLAKALGLTLEVPTEPKIVKQFGDHPMAALWPQRKSLAFLADARQLDARTFDALYMGRPAPDDGDHFTADMLVEYQREQLPKNLRKYAASDHAVAQKQISDSNVIGCVGVDDDDDIWVLPDLVWRKMPTDLMIDEMIAQMQMHKPQLWWMENELISKSFGPFLLKRMQEEKTYVTLDPIRPGADKLSRSRSIQGRMSMRKVRFPAFAPWWKQARSQLLKFPHGTHDDFVDWLSLIGLGLLKLMPADRRPEAPVKEIPTGSIQWILAETQRKALKEKRTSRYAYG